MRANSIQAIVVLGGGVSSDGKPLPASAMRTAKAVELAELFPNAMLIMSGNASIRTDRVGGDDAEATVMKKYAVSLGADPQRFLLENGSRDTLANARLTKKHYLAPRKFYNVVVVTSGFHIARAEYLFRKVLGPDYSTTFVSAGGDVSLERLIKEGRSLTFARALFDTVADGDDDEIRRRIDDWLHPKNPRFTLDEWCACVDHGVALPAFPDYIRPQDGSS
ncbi:hypothetical protein CR970_02850 [Candidatus Saccharibacteria bacterium]|nr:MAG: hypothetical protein CR970_02850 [Candidatus Saccharibacteria bacterium]